MLTVPAVGIGEVGAPLAVGPVVVGVSVVVCVSVVVVVQVADRRTRVGIGPLVAPTLVTASLVVRGGLATAALVALVTVALLVRGRHTRGTGVFMVAGWLALVPMLVSAS